MNKVLVMNTYKEKLNMALKHTDSYTAFASLEEGAGRIQITPGEKLDLIVFASPPETKDLVRYTDNVERFYSDLKMYNLIHEGTIYH